MSFDPGQLERLAGQEFERDLPELTPLPFGTVDDDALQIAQALRAELADSEHTNSL